MFLLLLPVLTRFLLLLVFAQAVAICVPAKVQLPIIGNKGVWISDGVSGIIM